MVLYIVTAALGVAAAVYWYVNRHKPMKYILSELRYTLDMQGAGAGGLIDDWVSVWNNKVTLPDANNKIAVITGGARGIGTEVVRGMLKANMVVIMGVRNPDAAKKLAKTMDNGEKLHAFRLDLQSLKSVKEFAENVKKEFPAIHLLVNNAGIMFGDYKLTEDGIETQLAVNHLSHFYLSHLLLPALKQGGTLDDPARIVNVSSCGHFPGKIYFDDINMKEHYDTTAAYAQSKLAQIMTARYMNSMFTDKDIPIRCYSVHPGIVDTDLFEHASFGKLPWARKLFFKTPEKGAVSILYACFNKDILNKGGLYISNCKEGFSNRFSKNEKHQQKLFELSCNLVGIDVEKFARS
ncbi:retinol dehydrogenase 11 [Colias croceus]|uniref:retinol dehydrogenase 11 n=1 Tax=Colias crocea TaxID=72248 RepID=UPI001E27FD49|nr:retinol dehydrogenase 11 [Colias croceus]XP_045495411.1 retinol dehydrogenase 11 [Colias croceus]